MIVELLNHMGSDRAIVDAARVSFYKDSSKYTEEQNNKLLVYLAKHNHWSPFAHCTLSFRITAPVFIARQLAKHQVGFAWNEVSRRYIDSDPRVWQPIEWRQRSALVKQGSSSILTGAQDVCDHLYGEAIDQCLASYTRLLIEGVCPEQARAVLPMAMLTQWIWTGSLYGFSRVYKLRTDEDTQLETRDIATRIGKECSYLFPQAWEALHGVASLD